MTGFSHRLQRFLITLLCLALLSAPALPMAAFAQDSTKTVRVGWYDSSYNTIDETGRRYGYAYDYQQKIAAYTGWTYEYVKGSWPDLMQMMEDGEIDLMSDVSYKPDRAEKMLYASVPMGAEEYYIFTSPNNTEISSVDPKTLEGKRVGVNKSSIQLDFFEDWKKTTGINAETVLVACSEAESLAMLETGELDAYVTVDAFVDTKVAVPVCMVGSSDFYFVVSKARPDLLSELDVALNQILEENRYYNQQLFDKYIRRAGANAFLSGQETAWLSEHDTIRIGYQDNYLAFCAQDEETGELKGVIKDYLAYAADCMANAHLDFEPVAYPTAAAAVTALQNGEIDCMFPANFSAYDSEVFGLILTPALTDTEVFAVTAKGGEGIFAKNRQSVTVAVNTDNPNYDTFLQIHFPSWTPVYFETTQDCLRAVAEGRADCVLVSNVRYNNISRTCEHYHLSAISTGVDMEYSFAVRKGNTALYSILTKVVGQVPETSFNTALSRYISDDAKLTFLDYLEQHMALVLSVLGAIALIIFLLLLQNMRAVRKAKQLIAATETDALTGLYNRSFFFQYAEKLHRDNPNTPMDAIVLNIEQFHSVNALSGRGFGDQCLRALGRGIAAVVKENGGIGGRFGADRFDIFCRHLEDYPAIFDRLQGALDKLSPHTTIPLRMGVMPWMPEIEPEAQFDHARTACSMGRGHFNKRLIIFDEEVRKREQFEQRLQHDLRNSVANGEFEVYYQPMFDIRQPEPQLVCAEALVRWHHPEFGTVRPDDFIPLFERNGQITMLDRFVWKQAISQVAAWKQKYGRLLPVSINLSRVDVIDPTLKPTLRALLDEYGLDQTAVKLEVTESAYIENAAHVIPVIEKLRAKGYEVEMDDFGSGYSSLNMLSTTPIDYLKMDKAFVQNVEKGEKDVLFIDMILGIAQNLNISVVAEGVETQAQFDILRQKGCAIVQGFYFSQPLPAFEFEQKYFGSAE